MIQLKQLELLIKAQLQIKGIVMAIRKKEYVYFLLSAVIFILIVNIFSEKGISIDRIRLLGFSDVMKIFSQNLGYIFISLLFSFLGLSFVFIIKVLFLIGQGPSQFGINPIIYYACSFFHGVGELIVCSIVFYFTINQFKIIIGYYLGKKTFSEVKSFYISFIKSYLPKIIVILLISALVEVYISNRLIRFFIN